MKSIFSILFPAIHHRVRDLVMLLALFVAGTAAPGIGRPPERTIATPPGATQSGGPAPLSLTPRRIEIGDGGKLRLMVSAGLTILEAGPDDTLRARLRLTLAGDERQRLARLRPEIGATSLPETVLDREVRLHWRRGTACPDLDLALPALKFSYLETELTSRPTSLRIDVAADTVQTLPQLLCNWTRQINAGRPRLGIILAINRLLTPFEPER